MSTRPDIATSNAQEIVSTILLSLAALAVTWCSYQSNLWNGVQSFKLAESNLYSRQAQQNLLTVKQRQEIDAAVAIDFLGAVLDNKQKHIDYYLSRGKSDLRSILASWLTSNPLQNRQAPAHPLATREYEEMISKALAQSDSAISQSEILWKQAQQANSISDKYTLATVIFSLVMFLGAIATKMTQSRITKIFLAFAGIIFLVVLAMLFILPARWTD
jgi:hypothetical protein